ncbi:hypothetical protein DL769_001041 [Monosporascus sp. CRB-8-3]|nr:hypothetical protein DL769_001041 [Monosporascus sp. CRB-8-3]
MFATSGSKLVIASYGALLLLTLLSTVLARAVPGHDVATLNERDELHNRAGRFYLRIMPLGASITRGDPGDPELEGRGYRKYLRDRLRVRGWKVNMVGSQRWGSRFNDNDNEGWPGFVVGPEDGTGDNAVHAKAKSAVPKYKPNLVLLNCGTNDAVQNNDLDNVGKRMEAMLKTVFDSSPGVVVILSTLVPSRDHDAKVTYINEQYRALVRKFLNDGYKIQLADMHDGFITLDEIWDGTHPTAIGALRMASVWDLAIQEVEKRGDWLQEPSSEVDFEDDANNQCEKKFKSGESDPRSGQQVLYARSGQIHDDGTYEHESKFRAMILALPRVNEPYERRTRLYAAQFVNQGADRGGERDDLIWVNGDHNEVHMFMNKGGRFGDRVKVNIDGDCISRGIRWGDVNNDGLDDFICIHPNGDMWVSINDGQNPPNFKGVGKFKDAVPGYPQANVRLGDIDGDGRLDYCVIDNSGDVYCWRNGGIQHDRVEYWQDLGRVFTAEGKGLGAIDIEAMRLGDGVFWGDMTGTGNDDYVWIDPEGNVVVFANRNTPPDTNLYKDGAAWDDKGIVLRTGMDRKALHIGDWNGDGKADVIGVEKRTGAMTVWLTNYNNGAFSFSKQTSEQAYCNQGWGVGRYDLGMRFADITGSGCVDYLCLELDGRTTAWLNDCKSDLFDLRNVGQVKFAEPSKDRANIRFADVNGDGRADYLWVDKFIGDTSAWINGGERPESERPNLGGSKFFWEKKGPVYSGSSRGPNMHFPNLGGVGRADMVHVDPTTAHGWVWFNSCPAGGDDGGFTPRDPELPLYEPMPMCPWPLCYSADNSWGCGMDPAADDFSDEYICEDPESESLSASEDFSDAQEINTTNITANDPRSLSIDKRGEKRSFQIDWTDLAIAFQIIVQSRRYPGSTHLHDLTRSTPASDLAFRMAPGCTSTAVNVIDRTALTRQQILDGWDTEHNPDLQFIRDFIYTLGTGILPDGTQTLSGHISGADIQNYWNARVLPRNLPRAGSSRCITKPNEYFMDRFGSHGNRSPMLLCERNLNQVKGRVFDINTPSGRPTSPMAQDTFQELLDDAVTSVAAQTELFENLRMVIGVFNYINHPQALPVLRANIRELENAADEISASVGALRNVGPIFREFYPIWYREAATLAQTWVSDRLNDIIGRFTGEIMMGTAPPNARGVREMVHNLFNDLGNITSPF